MGVLPHLLIVGNSHRETPFSVALSRPFRLSVFLEPLVSREIFASAHRRNGERLAKKRNERACLGKGGGEGATRIILRRPCDRSYEKQPCEARGRTRGESLRRKKIREEGYFFLGKDEPRVTSFDFFFSRGGVAWPPLGGERRGAKGRVFRARFMLA